MEKMCLSVTEVSEALGVSRPTVYKLLGRTDFPRIKIERRVLIPVDELQRWITSQVEREGA